MKLKGEWAGDSIPAERGAAGKDRAGIRLLG